MPVTFTVTAAGGFKMAGGAATLNYQLCFDTTCAFVIPNGVIGGAVLVDRAVYDLPFYGQIFANQVAPPGPYAQLVTVTMTF